MKKLILSSLVALIVSTVGAQIPNGNFELWETMLGTTVKTPSKFVSSNFDVYDGGEASVFEIAGTSGKGVSLVSYIYVDPDNNDEYPTSAFLMAGEINILQGKVVDKFPITGRPVKLKGMYSYLPKGEDHFMIAVILYKNGIPVGTANWEEGAETNGFVAFSMNIEYTQTVTPDSAALAISSSSDSYDITEGTTLNLDELSFENEGPNGILSMEKSAAIAYPVPAQSSVNIALPSLNNTAKYIVLNAQGQEVMNGAIAETSSQLSLNIEGLPNGAYFFRAQDGITEARCKIIVAH